MKKRLLFILLSLSVFNICASAQKKSITNADLEKFKEKRLQAERDYQANYEKLGMPSPEELARRAEQKRVEYAEAAVRYRAERIQEEQSQAEREQSQAAQTYYNQTPNYGQSYYAPNYGYTPYNYQPFGYYNYSSGYNYPTRRYNNDGRINNQLPPIRVLTPGDIVRRTPIFTINRRNPSGSRRGRH